MATTARAATAAILVLGFLATLALSWPGHLSYDSVVQLHDGASGFYHSWHPPVMAWLLGLLGSGPFIALDASLMFAALLLIARRGASWPAAGFALVAVLTPQLVLYQAIVWKDVLFADAAVAGFVCLMEAERRWHGGWAVASVLLFALAALTRQNGLIVPIVGAVALGLIAPRRKWLHAVIALIGAGILVTAASFALAQHSDHDEGPVAQLKLLRLYDVIGAVKREPSLPLDRLRRDAPALERLIRNDGTRLYTPERNDTLVASGPLQNALADTPPGLMQAQWMDLVTRHTGLYVSTRLAVFGQVFLTPDIAACRPVFVGVEGSDGEMRDLGLQPRQRPSDRALGAYARGFMGTPVFSHLFFAVAGAIALVLLWRRGERALAFLLIAAFGFTASFFVLSIACDYRYLYFLDVATIAAWLYLFQVLAIWSGSFWLLRSAERKS